MRDLTDNTRAHTVQSPACLSIDEGTRPELVNFGEHNLSSVNIRQNTTGSAETRYGFTGLATALIDATTPTAGYKVFADRDTVVRICDGTAQVYDSVSATWKSLGRVPDCCVSTVDLPSIGTSSTLEDQEYANGYMAVTWRVPLGANVYAATVAVVNATSWAVVRAPEQLTSNLFLTNPMLGSYGTYFLLIVSEANTGDIRGYYLNTASAATITTGWVSMGTLVAADRALTFTWPDSITSATDRIAICYPNAAGGANGITVKTINIAGIVASTTVTNGGTTTGYSDIAYSATDNWLWVGTVRGNDAYVLALSMALASSATVANLLTTVTPTSVGIAPSSTAGKGRLVVNGTSRVDMRSFQVTAGAVATDGSAATVYNAQASGRPFQQGTRYYAPVWGGASTNDQKVCILADVSEVTATLRPVANVAPGLAVKSSYLKGKSPVGPVSSRRHFGLGITRSGVADASALAVFDYAHTDRLAPVAIGNSTFLSGSVLSYLDGVRVAEASFLIRPTLPTTATSGAGITAVTGWRYVCVYEEVDADGNWAVSGLSSPSASTGAVANKTVTVTTAPLTITARVNTTTSQMTSVRVAVYRTLDGGVSPYYRVATVLNDTSAATLSYADTTSDATLAANAKLYSQPGVVGTAQDRRPPPGLNVITSYNGMLVGANGSDVWYSGQNVSGESLWFNPIFQIPIPGEGPIMALAAMDGTLFVFKRREIYALTGEAPSDNGASGGLGQPRRLAVDVGCIESRSVCPTTIGIFFQSERGIEILTRAQVVDWIGGAVRVSTTDYPICSSAVAEPVSNTVLYEMAVSQSSGLVSGNGRTLVYDLSMLGWVSTDSRKSAAGVAAAPSQSACIAFNGTTYRYTWIAVTGTVHQESTAYLDADGTPIVPQFETAWLKHGLQQEQLVWGGTILYQKYSYTGLKVEVAYDYAAYSSANDKVWTEVEVAAATQLEWRPKPRGEAMKFRVTATGPDTHAYGPELSFIGMSFDLAPKQGSTKGTVRLNPALRK